MTCTSTRRAGTLAAIPRDPDPEAVSPVGAEAVRRAAENLPLSRMKRRAQAS
jgi:hypothetical protein